MKTILALLVGIGDFSRFNKGNNRGAYLGLTSREKSNEAQTVKIGMSKAGNGHLRKLLIESVQDICKGIVGYNHCHLTNSIN